MCWFPSVQTLQPGYQNPRDDFSFQHHPYSFQLEANQVSTSGPEPRGTAVNVNPSSRSAILAQLTDGLAFLPAGFALSLARTRRPAGSSTRKLGYLFAEPATSAGQRSLAALRKASGRRGLEFG